MTERRPLAWINGRPQAIPDTDTLPLALVPASGSAAIIDGGDWTQNPANGLIIDAGGWS